jgi:mRNA interferase MazF
VEVAQPLRRQVSRGEVYLVDLNPTRGSEIQKRRPCLIISPDEVNHHLRTVVVAPMTTGGYAYPTRIACRFRRTAGYIVLDQIRTVDSERLIRLLGEVTPAILGAVLTTLREMFAD